MPRITVDVGEREHLRAGIVEAPGRLPPKGCVWITTTPLQGPPAALRRLAAALERAADLAEHQARQRSRRQD